METKRLNDRGRDFWILTVLGILTCASLIRRVAYGFRLLTYRSWVYLGLSLLAVVVAWFYYENLQRGLSNVSEQIDETVLSRFQKAAGWLYLMVNVGVFALMHFVPKPWHMTR
jgi:uncharacterized membrane protein